ncbi:MAG: hypothetical protein RL699_1159 [Bacteroidota bacterium]|jgi:hypothetical protein
MKKALYLVLFLYITTLFAQLNPVQNLSWMHYYDYPNNFYELQWEAPAQPHDELLGYNVYRNNELYRFQTETSVYNLNTPLFGIVTNCTNDFLYFNIQGQPSPNGFDMHVTAVYNSGESDYLQTEHCVGPLLASTNFTPKQTLVYPNPTSGVLYLNNQKYTEVLVYNTSGQVVLREQQCSQLDLSNLPKGIYWVKLISANNIQQEKVWVY